MPESLFPPNRNPASIEDIFRFIPEPMETRITGDDDIEAVLLRWDFADQARAAFDRHDDAGADALMRLANETTVDAVQFMAERDRHVNPLYHDARIPGFVAAHYTGGRGEVHNPGSVYDEPSALSRVALPQSLQVKFGLGE